MQFTINEESLKKLLNLDKSARETLEIFLQQFDKTLKGKLDRSKMDAAEKQKVKRGIQGLITADIVKRISTNPVRFILNPYILEIPFDYYIKKEWDSINSHNITKTVNYSSPIYLSKQQEEEIQRFMDMATYSIEREYQTFEEKCEIEFKNGKKVLTKTNDLFFKKGYYKKVSKLIDDSKVYNSPGSDGECCTESYYNTTNDCEDCPIYISYRPYKKRKDDFFCGIGNDIFRERLFQELYKNRDYKLMI
jgi:hypothetical protein